MESDAVAEITPIDVAVNPTRPSSFGFILSFGKESFSAAIVTSHKPPKNSEEKATRIHLRFLFPERARVYAIVGAQFTFFDQGRTGSGKIVEVHEGSLAELWNQHRESRFPSGLGGAEIDGIDLVLLDADIAGCISTAVRSSGKLDPDRMEILRKCRRDLDVVIPALKDAGKQYFEHLKRMADFVLARKRQD